MGEASPSATPTSTSPSSSSTPTGWLRWWAYGQCGSPGSVRIPTVAGRLGRFPAGHGAGQQAQLFKLNEKLPYPDAQRVRQASVPRLVPGRPGAVACRHIPVCPPSCGGTTIPRRGTFRVAGSSWTSCSRGAGRREGGHGWRHPGTSRYQAPVAPRPRRLSRYHRHRTNGSERTGGGRAQLYGPVAVVTGAAGSAGPTPNC